MMNKFHKHCENYY